MRVVLELVCRVDPALDRDVARAVLGESARLGDRHDRSDSEDPADPVVGPERAQDRDAEGERG